MPPPRSRLLAGLAFLLLPALALGAHPLVTDDTGTQGKGRSQVEVTAEVIRENEAGVRERGGELAVTLSIGVHDAIDLVVSAPQTWSRVTEAGSVVADVSGLGDAAVELKVRVLELGGFSVAVKPSLSLPTGSASEGLGNGRPAYGATAIVSQELGRFALHAQAGWTRSDYALAEDRAAHRKDVYHASLAGTAEVRPRLSLAANVGFETSCDRSDDTPPAFAVAGAIWSLTDDLGLDLGVRTGLNAPEVDLAVLGGVAFRF